LILNPNGDLLENLSIVVGDESEYFQF